MKNYSLQLLLLFKRLLLAVIIFQLCRIAFYFANLGYFESSRLPDVLMAFVAGFRFDITAIIFINFIFIFVHLIPGNWFFHSITQNILRILFFTVNIPALLLNSVDMEYFKYQGKRTTADLFQLFGMGEDMKNTLPQMAMDFWYVLLIFFILTFVLIYYYNKIKIRKSLVAKPNLAVSFLLSLPLIGLAVIGSRGGLQYKPLNIMAAARHTTPQLVPLVLNTPFTVYKTLGKTLIGEKNYLPENEAKALFNKEHHYRAEAPFRPMNVIIIILESFSSEYIGAFNNGDGYTPFLDSLMREGMTFDNAFANAKKSIDGIPAVLASFPTLMPASYVTSPYSSNKLNSIAGMLKPKGYASAFFHGGNNGTMNFDNFTLLTGFDNYFGRKEYPLSHYDGHWGVYDEHFYYFFINKCSGMQQPFVTSFFSLSSHHPYNLPAEYKNKFRKGNLPIHESIGYADYSLRCFFEKAKTTAWYNNTLFVITSDHTGPSAKPNYNTKAGMFRIPIVFYHPGSNLKGWSHRVTQQTDIVPGILDYLDYDLPFVAFGNSMFDTTVTPFAVNFTGDVFQVVDDELLIQYDGTEIAGCYEYRTDSLLTTNTASPGDKKQEKLIRTLQSVLQQYNNSLIRNDLLPGDE